MNMLICLLFLVSGLCVGGPAPTDEKPEALLAAEQAHDASSVWTAHIEWSLRQSNPNDTEPARTRFFTWKCAGDTYLSVRRGDEEGIVHRGPDGKPAPITYNGPIHALMKDDEVWEHIERSPTARVWDKHRAASLGLYDLRSLGVNPLWRQTDLEEAARAAGHPPPQYDSSMDEGLVRVTASVKDGSFVWWIDPERDYNVVRTAVVLRGEKIGETRYTLQQFDGTWFPKRMEHYRLAAGDVEPSAVVEVLSAEFNRPEHPHELTQADIGIEVGTSVRLMDGSPPRMGYWDGDKLVSHDELLQRLESSELTIGSTKAREMARLRALGERRELLKALAATKPAASQPAARRSIRKSVESEWEAYTRRFILTYRLDNDQTQKALAILKKCQQRANRYLQEHKADFEDLDRRLQAAQQAKGKDAPKERQMLRARQKKLREPIDQIFEKQLKSGLERLPTQAQRKAAEQREVHRKGASGQAKPDE